MKDNRTTDAGNFEKPDGVEELLERIKELEHLNEEQGQEISDLMERVEDLKSEVEDLENAPPDLEDVSEADIAAAFYSNMSIDGSMVNDEKIEKFFENIDKFSLEDFEKFLKEKGAIFV